MYEIVFDEFEYMMFYKMKHVYERIVGNKVNDNDYLGYLIVKDFHMTYYSNETFEAAADIYLRKKSEYNALVNLEKKEFKDMVL